MKLVGSHFSSVAGVPVRDGIVVYWSQQDSPTSDMNLLLQSTADTMAQVQLWSQSNADALQQAAEAAVPVDPPTVAEVEESPRKETPETKQASPQEPTLWATVTSRLALTIRKSVNGGGMNPPPRMPPSQSMLTFFGVLLTLSILTKLNHSLETAGGTEIVLGPFGALLTLLYCLSGAPAAQPRNALFGQIVSLIIAISIGQYSGFPVWVKQSVATTLAITAMGALGVTHPPAGAAAMIFSSGTYGWVHMGMMLFANLIALSIALINNVSDKRQYPTFWGFWPEGLMAALALDDSDDRPNGKKNELGLPMIS